MFLPLNEEFGQSSGQLLVVMLIKVTEIFDI